MQLSQSGILADVPNFSRYLEFTSISGEDQRATLAALANRPWDAGCVIGFGPGLIQGLGEPIAGLRAFPNMTGPGIEVPSTQSDLWCWVRGSDLGDIAHQARQICTHLQDSFALCLDVSGFKYGEGRDLSGYIDGTENPEGDDAMAAAIVADKGAGLDGGSFVATQQWFHDLDHFETLSQETRDHIIGRRLSDNEELDDAPLSAHVKRTAQESFDPEAFIVRRSLPWSDASGEGLMFVAFGATLDAFEVQLRRMVGAEDGITDGLFQFSKPMTGSYFWCPPVKDGCLDLSKIGY